MLMGSKSRYWLLLTSGSRQRYLWLPTAQVRLVRTSRRDKWRNGGPGVSTLLLLIHTFEAIHVKRGLQVQK